MSQPIIGSIAIRVAVDGKLAPVDLPAGEASLEAIYEAIGDDHANLVPLAEGLDMWVGKGFTRAPVNIIATEIAKRYGFTSQPYIGTVLLARATPGGATVNLTPAQVGEIRRHLRDIYRSLLNP